MMKLLPCLLVISALYTNLARGQSESPPTDARYLIWQPDVEITFSDYTIAPDAKAKDLSARHGIGTVSVIELLRIVDIPKRKRDLKDHPERWYIAPAFCRKCSSLTSEDPTGLKHDRLYFDLSELAARYARMRMDSLYAQDPADNFASIWLETVCSDADEMMHRMFNTYGREVVLTRSDSAYASWRTFTDEMLAMRPDNTTKAEDRQRFMSGSPLSQDYKVAKHRMGDMLGRPRK